MTGSSLKGLKTLLEKEKLLATINFSFSRSVFKTFLQQTRKNQGLFGKGLKQLSTKVFFFPQCFRKEQRHTPASETHQTCHLQILYI